MCPVHCVTYVSGSDHCFNCQRYQSLATEQLHFTNIVGKINRSLFGSTGRQPDVHISALNTENLWSPHASVSSTRVTAHHSSCQRPFVRSCELFTQCTKSVVLHSFGKHHIPKVRTSGR